MRTTTAIMIGLATAHALCPLIDGQAAGQSLPAGHPPVPGHRAAVADDVYPAPLPGYADALANLDLDAVIADIRALLTDSKSTWPADYGNYGPFFVRCTRHSLLARACAQEAVEPCPA